jgi:hypothetical protein
VAASTHPSPGRCVPETAHLGHGYRGEVRVEPRRGGLEQALGFRGQVGEAGLLPGVDVDDGVVIGPGDLDGLDQIRFRGGTVGDHRHPEGHLRRHRDVAQEQVPERVGPGFGQGEGVVDAAVLPGELLGGCPRRRDRRGRQQGVHVGQAVRPRPHFHRAGAAGPRDLRGDLVGRHPGRDPPHVGGDLCRVQPGQPARHLGIHASARLGVQPGTGVDHLVRRRRRDVTGQDQVTHEGEPLTQGRSEVHLPPRQPLGHTCFQRDEAGRHLVHVPHRVDPLHRTVTRESHFDPRPPRGRDTLGALGRVHHPLELTGQLVTLACLKASAVLGQRTPERRDLRACGRDTAAELPPVHGQTLPEHAYESKRPSPGVRLQQNRIRQTSGTRERAVTRTPRRHPGRPRRPRHQASSGSPRFRTGVTLTFRGHPEKSSGRGEARRHPGRPRRPRDKGSSARPRLRTLVSRSFRGHPEKLGRVGRRGA